MPVLIGSWEFQNLKYMYHFLSYLILTLIFLFSIVNDFALTFPQDRKVEWSFWVPVLGFFSPFDHRSWPAPGPCWIRNAKYHRLWGTRFLLNKVRKRRENSGRLRGWLSTKHWTYVPAMSYWILFVSADQSEEAQRVRQKIQFDVSFTAYSEWMLPWGCVFFTEEHRSKK